MRRSDDLRGERSELRLVGGSQRDGRKCCRQQRKNRQSPDLKPHLERPLRRLTLLHEATPRRVGSQGRLTPSPPSVTRQSEWETPTAGRLPYPNYSASAGFRLHAFFLPRWSSSTS